MTDDRRPWIPAPPPPEIDIPEGVRAGETRTPDTFPGVPIIADPRVPPNRAFVVSPSTEPGCPPSVAAIELSAEGHHCVGKVVGVSTHPSDWKTAVLYQCTECGAPFSNVLIGYWTMADVDVLNPRC